jgi:endonuclease YncB( thermonuclease family)
MRGLAIPAGILIVGGLAAFGWFSSGGSEIRATAGPPPLVSVSPSPEGIATGDVSAAVRPAEPAPHMKGRPSRVVGAGLIAAPLFDATELERLPPRPPLTDEDPAGEGSARTRLLHRPIAVSPGELTAQGYRIRLSGIRFAEPDASCTAENGSKVPCDRLALAALRRFLRGRAVECEVPEKPPAEPVTARCMLAGKDLSQWLVANGWARAAGPADGEARSFTPGGQDGPR